MKSLQEIEQRTQRYWFEDGIWDVGFGFFLLLMAAYFFVTSLIDLQGIVSMIIPLGLVLVMLSGMWMIGQVVRMLKERITYPRTGYVKYRQKPAANRLKKMLLAGLFALILGALFGFLSSTPAIHDRISALIGFFLALVCVFLGWRFSVLRYYIVGFVTLILGFGISLIPFGFMPQTIMFFAGFGVAWILSGVVALVGYLRQTHPISSQEEEQDHER